MEKNICQKCGRENKSGVKTCIYCLNKIEPTKEETINEKEVSDNIDTVSLYEQLLNVARIVMGLSFILAILILIAFLSIENVTFSLIVEGICVSVTILLIGTVSNYTLKWRAQMLKINCATKKNK